MSEIGAIAAIALDGTAPAITQLGLPSVTGGPAAAGFANLLSTSLASVDQKIASANQLVRRFAVDDNVPVHHVTLALEEAKLAVELAMEVRSRVIETYREVMNMQL